MIKNLALGGAAIAAFAGLVLATPAHAVSGPPWPSDNETNVATQSDNVIVCGNRGIGAITTTGANVGPLTFANNEAVDCSIRATQN